MIINRIKNLIGRIPVKSIPFPRRTLMVLFSPYIYSTIHGVLGYTLGYLIEEGPNSIQMALNNGLYLLGVNIQFRFKPLLATITFFTSLISNLFFTHKPQELPPPETPPPPQIIYQPVEENHIKVPIEDIAENLASVTTLQERLLEEHGIYDIEQLSKLKPQDLIPVLKISPSLAKEMIEEAKQVIQEWIKEGLIS